MTGQTRVVGCKLIGRQRGIGLRRWCFVSDALFRGDEVSIRGDTAASPLSLIPRRRGIDSRRRRILGCKMSGMRCLLRAYLSSGGAWQDVHSPFDRFEPRNCRFACGMTRAWNRDTAFLSQYLLRMVTLCTAARSHRSGQAGEAADAAEAVEGGELDKALMCRRRWRLDHFSNLVHSIVLGGAKCPVLL